MTRRIVSVWLPRFFTDRIERKKSAKTSRHDKSPLAVIADGKGGQHLVAVNAAAEAAGLRPGLRLTDALAICPKLITRKQTERSEAKDLARLAAWATRYAPHAAPDAPDGLLLDITGCAHLFGGEEALLDDIVKRLNRFGFEVHAAAAGTVGAAWALARYGGKTRIAASGDETAALAPLPVDALRIDEETAHQLERLGLKTIGQLAEVPRESLRSRFGEEVGRRLDQALGREGEAISPLMPEKLYTATASFPEPITQFEAIKEAAQALIAQVVSELQKDDKGARRFVLRLFDSQGGVTEVIVMTVRPNAEPKHIAGLFRERFMGLEGRFDATLGFETITLEATRIEPLKRVQQLLRGVVGEQETHPQELSALLDRLSARLGSEAITRFQFQESYVPERACINVPVTQARSTAIPSPRATAPRPLMLLPRAEAVTVIAELPDYPPRRFTWRGVRRRVVRAEGPERIAPEWWQASDDGAAPRDYYAVEDETGARFWLYREGFYGHEGTGPRWYLHGLFA